MKRSRVVIACCAGGKQAPPQPPSAAHHRDPPPPPPYAAAASGSSSFTHAKHHRLNSVTSAAENRGAHNKNADCNGAPPTALLKLERCDDERPRDLVSGGRDVVTNMVVGGGGGKNNGLLTSSGGSARSHLPPGAAAAAAAADMHVSNSDKSISKKEKARQKFSNSLLKRAKVLITDRASQSSPYRVSATPPLNPDKFKVLKLKAAIDKKPTTIDERSTAVLKYRTPHFRFVCLLPNWPEFVRWRFLCTHVSITAGPYALFYGLCQDRL